MKSWSSLAPLVFLALTGGCGRQLVEFQLGGPTPTPTTTPTGNVPIVTAVLPVNNATGVATNTVISATFNEAMNPATLTTGTFTLVQGTTTVPGTVTWSASSLTASFVPTAALGTSRLFTATITTGAKSSGGVALAPSYPWKFTTSNIAGPPTVIATTPSNGAINISISERPTATFSKAMDPATITTLTFTLTSGGTLVPGTVALDNTNNTATFTPTTTLQLDTLYKATITTGAQDTGHNPLAAPYIWTFTTGACSMAVVNLASATDFAVLAGSTITNTGATAITGNVGVYAGTAISGLTAGQVTGTIYAGGPVAQQAKTDLNTAYTDASTRTVVASCPSPTVAAGELGGLTLIPGLYSSGSALQISAGALTLNAQGDPDAVWVFQAGSTLDITGAVVLTSGANAANVFWAVGSSSTIASGSAVQGTIMAQVSITMNTGASLTNGRALAETGGVTLQDNAIVAP